MEIVKYSTANLRQAGLLTVEAIRCISEEALLVRMAISETILKNCSKLSNIEQTIYKVLWNDQLVCASGHRSNYSDLLQSAELIAALLKLSRVVRYG